MIGPIRGQCPAITWWQEVSRRLLSNVVRPDMTLYTGNWHKGTFTNQTPRRKSIRGDKEEGCVVWYFGTESLTLAGWLLATLHGNAKFAYFQNHWVGSCVQGQLSSARNMWSHTSSSWLPSQKNVSMKCVRGFERGNHTMPYLENIQSWKYLVLFLTWWA